MKIKRYGLTLSRLTENDIELVRKWRNDPLINQYMEYRTTITPKMQQQWFESINNAQNFFYIIDYQGSQVGMISTFNVDWKEKRGEAGIFIWQKDLWTTPIPVFAVLAMLDINFWLFDIKEMRIKVKKTNKRALSYNKGLGYELLKIEQHKNKNKKENKEKEIEIESESDFDFYYLKPTRYFQKTKNLRQVAAKLHGKMTNISINEQQYPQITERLKIATKNIQIMEALTLSLKIKRSR